MNLAAESLAISSPMVLRFPSLKRYRHCFTSLEPGDLQVVLGDFPWDIWHVQGFSHEDVSVGAEEADERAFLFGGERGTNAHHFSLGAPRVYEDFFRAFHWLEGPD